jgi:hypothetical protein
MKRIAPVFVFCTIMLASCIETGTNTTINADGSGLMVASVDFSNMLKMMTQGKEKGEDIKLDTTIYVRDHSDTSSLLTVEQKRLLREMWVKVSMDISDVSQPKFMISIVTNFNSLEDLTALHELMKKKEYDLVFDKAMKIPLFMDKNEDDEENSKENDNLFASVFPDFFQCGYKKNSIACRLDTAMYHRSLQELQKSGFNMEGEQEAEMFASATFINMISLPSDVKEIKGSSIKKDKADNKLVQTGNLLDLYKHPENYEYNIQY